MRMIYILFLVMGVPCQNIFSFEELDTLLSNQASSYCLVRCLLARAAYGGMNCDQNMLHYYSTTWTNRFLLKSHPPESVEQPTYLPYLHIHSEMNEWEKYLHSIYSQVHNPEISIKTVSAMVPDDIPLAAIDFHCTSIVTFCIRNSPFSCTNNFRVAVGGYTKEQDCCYYGKNQANFAGGTHCMHFLS